MSWVWVCGEFPLSATVAQENDPDFACMVRLRMGDDLALDELMERWQKPLHSFTKSWFVPGIVAARACRQWRYFESRVVLFIGREVSPHCSSLNSKSSARRAGGRASLAARSKACVGDRGPSATYA